MAGYLKPNLSKVASTIILLGLSSMLWRSFVVMRISDTFPLGFPFPFYESWGRARQVRFAPNSTCSFSFWMPSSGI